MRKLIIIALALTFAVSCNVEEFQPDFINAPVFYGQIESEPLSKTGLSVDPDGVGTILWKTSDNINVFFGTKSVKYTSNNSDEAIQVTFDTKEVITDTDAASNNIWGLYPYDSGAECDGSSVITIIPNVQKCVDNTFGTDLFPMIAHSGSNTLQFQNICGGIKFSLSRDDIKCITIKGNNDEDIAGKVKVSINEDGKPETSIISGEKQITITPESGSTFKQNTNYYIVMPPIVLLKGFTMIFETLVGVGILNYEEKPVVIKRSIFGAKEIIDTEATSISLDKSLLILCKGDVAQLAATLSPTNSTEKGLNWESSNPSVASVSSSGKVTAISNGISTISVSWAKDNNIKATCEVRVHLDIPYVDLGLPSGLKWATYNIGATRPEGYGDYYAWGETSTKLEYTSSNYKYKKKNDTLELEDDVAHYKYGEGWRIPTPEDCMELICNCKVTETQINGVNGYKFTSKKNGASIFLPNAGRKFETSIYYFKEQAYYWTAKRGKYFNDGVFNNSNSHVGYSIRPVYNASSINDKQPANPSSGLVDLGLSVKWRSCNLGATKPEEFGGYYQWAGTRNVSDTGLYLDWWTSSSSEIGAPYVSGYNGSTSSLYISKYNSNSKGKVDNKSILDPCDDAASYHLGGKWRTPTKSEWQELINKCSFTYIVLNGVGGYKIQSTVSGFTSNWIFLPFAGERVERSLIKYNCAYWSATGGDLSGTCITEPFYGTVDKPTLSGSPRYYGYSIRPVSD